jgi:hypothetical protein
MYIFSFLVEGGTEGICTCTEEHEINYEYHDEQKQISPLHREQWLYEWWIITLDTLNRNGQTCW